MVPCDPLPGYQRHSTSQFYFWWHPHWHSRLVRSRPNNTDMMMNCPPSTKLQEVVASQRRRMGFSSPSPHRAASTSLQIFQTKCPRHRHATEARSSCADPVTHHRPRTMRYPTKPNHIKAGSGLGEQFKPPGTLRHWADDPGDQPGSCTSLNQPH